MPTLYLAAVRPCDGPIASLADVVAAHSEAACDALLAPVLAAAVDGAYRRAFPNGEGEAGRVLLHHHLARDGRAAEPTIALLAGVAVERRALDLGAVAADVADPTPDSDHASDERDDERDDADDVGGLAAGTRDAQDVLQGRCGWFLDLRTDDERAEDVAAALSAPPIDPRHTAPLADEPGVYTFASARELAALAATPATGPAPLAAPDTPDQFRGIVVGRGTQHLPPAAEDATAEGGDDEGEGPGADMAGWQVLPTPYSDAALAVAYHAATATCAVVYRSGARYDHAGQEAAFWPDLLHHFYATRGRVGGFLHRRPRKAGRAGRTSDAAAAAMLGAADERRGVTIEALGEAARD